MFVVGQMLCVVMSFLPDSSSLLLNIYRSVTRIWGERLAYCHLARRVRLGKENLERLKERQGYPDTKVFKEVQGKGGEPVSLIWIHGASVGESLSALPLIKRLLIEDPLLRILVTTGTQTSARLLETKLPPRVVHQFIPLDVPAWIDHFLQMWRPRLVLWLESEIWPNTLCAIKDRQIPLVMVNGRMSPRSFKKWHRWGKTFIHPVLDCFDLCYVQSSEDEARFKRLGAPRVMLMPNLKMAAEPLDYDPQERQVLEDGLGTRPFWIAASTHETEEEHIMEAHRILKHSFPDLLTILIPRHPHRAQRLKEKFQPFFTQGMWAQRSLKESVCSMTEVYLVDTLGELGLFYSLGSPANIVFVGGSLAPVGGHNIIEPAHFSSAILHGPFMENTQRISHLFQESHAALTVHNAEELAQAVKDLFENSPKRYALGEAAFRLIHQHKSSTLDQITQTLLPFLHKSQ